MASTFTARERQVASVVPTGTDRLDSVQILRGVAALAVVFNHAAIWLVHEPSIAMPRSLLAPIPAFGQFGGFGVDLFFVISGFVMTLGAGRFVGPRGALMFLAQRFVRVAPLFYLFSLVLLGVMLAGGQRIDPMSLINTVTIVPIFDQGRYAWPIHYLGWTLAFEFIFYLLVAAGLALGVRRLPFLLLGLLGLLPFVGLWAAPFDVLWRMLTSPFLWEFGFGVVAYLAFRRGMLATWRPLLATAFTIVFIGVLVELTLMPNTTFAMAHNSIDGHTAIERSIDWGVPALLLFASVIGSGDTSGPVAAAMKIVGDASYSIYLSHLAVVRMMVEVVERVALDPDLAILVTLGASIAAGLVSYRLLELPMLRHGRRRLATITWLRPSRTNAVHCAR